MVKACIFDLDGTLLNTLSDLTCAVNMVLCGEGFPERTEEEIRGFLGDGVRKLMERSMPAGTPENITERGIESFRRIYQKHSRENTCPYPKIPELLKQLRSMGIQTGVVSNKIESAVIDLCQYYFPGLLDVSVGDKDGFPVKPSPDNLYRAMSLLDIKTDEVIYVGDSDVDIHTGENAGVFTVGVLWGFRDRKSLEEAGAKHIIEKPEELLFYINGKALL